MVSYMARVVILEGYCYGYGLVAIWLCMHMVRVKVTVMAKDLLKLNLKFRFVVLRLRSWIK